MKTSESLDKISPALVKAQAAMTFARKDQANPHFKSNFAGLPSVIDAVKAPLNDNGIAFIQTPSPSEDGKLHLTTRLIHTSGQWIEDTAVCPLPKADPQGFGSASTYLRRYSLAAITGLYQDDDDGNGATPSEGTPAPASAIKTAGKPLGSAVPSLATRDQLAELAAMEMDNTTSERVAKALAHYKVKRIEDLTTQQAGVIIKRITDDNAKESE